MEKSANAFIGEVNGDAEPRLLDEPALHFVDCLHVQRPREIVRGVRQVAFPAGVAVHVFVDVADAVLPSGVFPFLRGQFVFQHARETVERGHLSRLFFHCHAAEQVGDAGIVGK